MHARREVLVAILAALSGCSDTPSISGISGDDGDGDEGDASESPPGCSEEINDTLLVLRPVEGTDSEETWREIRSVAEQRSEVLRGPVNESAVNGTRAITIRSYTYGFEEWKDLYLSRSTFSIYLGSAGSMTEVVNESMEVERGGPQELSEIVGEDGPGWEVLLMLGKEARENVQSAVEGDSGEVRIRTKVNGEIVDERTKPHVFRQTLKEQEYRGEFVAYVPDRRTGLAVKYAGTRPPFPVELNVSTHRCRDGEGPDEN